ncbi:hypothetical protein [Bradyrhizobium sp. AUGA SZCCT0182]|uniref:hypothetical protein n=1 Tax=Bradyrhizobium sp. AUGA SZCCT0182 TaxID=2807667 RepID=UPI001BA9C816|nr:hypothetical protein [Bradyrhizobium sp. AUGA SZCCT0182]MBR1237870.1 hypothetical protein [Bradyrhizobium sp. AUGA SZCCT0182]
MIDLDNPNAVVLDVVVRKLILQQCCSSADPDAVLAEWKVFLKQQNELFMRLFGSDKLTDEVGAKAFVVASEFERFSEDLADDFRNDGLGRHQA